MLLGRYASHVHNGKDSHSPDDPGTCPDRAADRAADRAKSHAAERVADPGARGAAERAARASVCIDRCVCFRRTFVELLAVADASGARSLEQLQEETEFGLSCRLCNPYVRQMLRTRQTVFHTLLQDAPSPKDED